MTRSMSETKALQSCSDQLQQSIFWLLARPVASNYFRRQLFFVLNSEFGWARLWSACLNWVLIDYVFVSIAAYRGWGLRCLDDIPQGAFVCIYAGQLWGAEEANIRGQKYGDEYFAELDHIGGYFYLGCVPLASLGQPRSRSAPGTNE